VGFVAGSFVRESIHRSEYRPRLPRFPVNGRRRRPNWRAINQQISTIGFPPPAAARFDGRRRNNNIQRLPIERRTIYVIGARRSVIEGREQLAPSTPMSSQDIFQSRIVRSVMQSSPMMSTFALSSLRYSPAVSAIVPSSVNVHSCCSVLKLRAASGERVRRV